MQQPFLFCDDEGTYRIITGDQKKFEELYCRFQNYYSENQLDYSDFYDQLTIMLHIFGMDICCPFVVTHNSLDFNKYKNGKQD